MTRALIVLLLLGFSAPALAYTDESGVVTENTASTLGAGTFHLGLWQLGAGITDSLDVGTYLWVWALPMPNAHVKWRFCCNQDWGLSVRTGASYTDTSLLWFVESDDTSAASIWVVPVELTATWQFADAWNVSVMPAYYQVSLNGNFNEDDFAGASAVSNLQAVLQFEWRFNRVVSFLVTGRRVLATSTKTNVNVELQLDDFTSVEVVSGANTNSVESPNLGNLMLGAVLSWQSFNLRLGVGAGNWNLPVVNFMAGEKGAVFDADLYWRF